MDYRFLDSPARSPQMAPMYSSMAQSYESSSNSSTPGSPEMNQIFYDGIPVTYDMLSFENASQAYDSVPERVQFEYLGSSTLDDHDRRRKKPAINKDSEKESNMHLRRRAQNRASQRAFRERKEKHVKNLEEQLQDLREKHQDLLQSYTRQTDEVQQLNDRIQNLTSELDILRTAAGIPFTDAFEPPEKFDLVPYSGMSYAGSEQYYAQETLNV